MTSTITSNNCSERPGLILPVICIALALGGCRLGSEENPEFDTEHVTPTVEAIEAGYGTLPLVERLTGVVKAKNQIEIFPEISAAILEVYVRNGDIVEKGRPLIRLQDKDFQDRLRQSRASRQIALAQAKQADARLREARTELGRMESLSEKGLASQAELEAAQTKAISAEADFELAGARVDQAQATVDEREQALSETVVRAPVSGTVGDRNAEVGMIVGPGIRLFTMGQLEEMKVEVILTDRMLHYIESGQRTEIYTENPTDRPLSSPLSRISPFLHPVTHSTVAEIDVVNSGRNLIPGMFVTVDIHYGESDNATLVPLSALFENPVTGVTGVYLSRDSLSADPAGEVDMGRGTPLPDPVPFRFVPVEVVAEGRMNAGIRGVDPGAWVVTLGQNLIGADTGIARVRTVRWDWVEQLQTLQRQDLLREIMYEQQRASGDSGTNGSR